jgi:hypothetical protein
MRRLLIALLAISLPACSVFGSKYITAKDWGTTYPFTVDGYLECEAGGAIVFKGGGMAYAVNGTAKNKGYPGIEPIWKDNPVVPGAKVDIVDVISEGQKLCK